MQTIINIGVIGIVAAIWLVIIGYTILGVGEIIRYFKEKP